MTAIAENLEQALIDACQKRHLSIGGGEVVTELYLGSEFVGEIFSLNGTQQGETAGDITQIRLSYGSISEVPQGKAEWVCTHCAYEIDAFDAIYWAEYPNSASDHFSSLREEHLAEHQSQSEIDEFVKFKLKTLSEKGKKSIMARYLNESSDDSPTLDKAIINDGYKNGMIEDTQKGYWSTFNLLNRRKEDSWFIEYGRIIEYWKFCDGINIPKKYFGRLPCWLKKEEGYHV